MIVQRCASKVRPEACRLFQMAYPRLKSVPRRGCGRRREPGHGSVA
ncbi:MAG: hypothetical protein L6Q26_01575 [Anaerolineales bacterium]|nr:hypothetical protein [Anaerolineales bacterium]NUQ85921.1 hypothetical protein [Anaerolineales bacterium]